MKRFPVSESSGATNPAENQGESLVVIALHESLIKMAGPTNKTFDEIVSDPQTIPRLMEKMKTGYLSQSRFAMALGMVATFHKPKEGYVQMGVSRPVDSKYEDLERKLWRQAINLLRNLEIRPKNPNKFSQEVWQERIRAAERAHSWLRSLEATEESPETKFEMTSEIVPEIVTQEEKVATTLDFEVLPAAPTENNGGLRERLGSLRERFENQELDESRLRFIFALADKYKGQVFACAFGRQEGGGQALVSQENPYFDGNYLIAVFDKLDEETEIMRKFAVAEYVKKDRTKAKEDGDGRERVASGAVYAYEELPGSSDTWRNMFALTRNEARERGVRKFTHRGDLEGRLENFLSGKRKTSEDSE